MMFLGKVNNVVKAETLKCANMAIARYNSHGRSAVNVLTADIARDTDRETKSEHTLHANLKEIKVYDIKEPGPIFPEQDTERQGVSTFLPNDRNMTSIRKRRGSGFSASKKNVVKNRGPLKHIIALAPSRAFTQSVVHGSTNVSDSTLFDSKRYESIHTEKTSVSFACPLPQKPRKVGEKIEAYRKMDCASLSQAGAVANVLAPGEKPRFGCKEKKKNTNKEPNACGVIFECPKPKVEPPKKTDCPLSVTVLVKDEFGRRLQDIVGKVCKTFHVDPHKYMAMIGNTIAVNVPQINSTRQLAYSKNFNKMSIFENGQSKMDSAECNGGRPDWKTSEKQGPRRLINKSAFRKRMQARYVNRQPVSNNKLKISDAELLRLSLKDDTRDIQDMPVSGCVLSPSSDITATSNTDTRTKSPEKLRSDELFDLPASVLTPIMPTGGLRVSDEKFPPLATKERCERLSLEDMERIAVEGGQLEVGCPGKSSQVNMQSNKSGNGDSKGFKPQPGQVCCPKDEPKPAEAPKEPEKPKQICCPPKDKSKQEASKDKSPPAGAKKPEQPTSKCQTPATKATESKVCKTPETKGSESKVCKTPETKGSESKVCKTPESKGSESKICKMPESKGTEAKASKAPEAKGSESKICKMPESKGTEAKASKAPEAKGSESKICKTPAPKAASKAPETKGSEGKVCQPEKGASKPAKTESGGGKAPCNKIQCDASKKKPPATKPPPTKLSTNKTTKTTKTEDPGVFNCCLSITGQRKVEINNCPMPELNDNNVIVKMHTVGLGTSDVYMFDKGPTKDSSPVVLGHEASGIVYKVGKNVKHLKPGDMVALEPGISCGGCEYCKTGRTNLCPAMKFNGFLQTYCAHPAHFCYKIPKTLNPTNAALAHPLAMALHACRRAKVCVGSSVLILGACPLGLSTVMAARSMGADKIAVVDTLEKNLKVAYDLCADKTVLATADMGGDQLADKACSELKANPNVVIDCCGCSKTLNLALLALKPGGSLVLAGCQADCAQVPLLAVLAKEICVCGSFRTCSEFGSALCMIESGRANVAKLITHRSEFCEAQEAFNSAVDEEKSGAIKVVVFWPHSAKKK